MSSFPHLDAIHLPCESWADSRAPPQLFPPDLHLCIRFYFHSNSVFHSRPTRSLSSPTSSTSTVSSCLFLYLRARVCLYQNVHFIAPNSEENENFLLFFSFFTLVVGGKSIQWHIFTIFSLTFPIRGLIYSRIFNLQLSFSFRLVNYKATNFAQYLLHKKSSLKLFLNFSHIFLRNLPTIFNSLGAIICN